MNRQCHDCHRWEPAPTEEPALVASGGFCVPSNMMYSPFEQEDWYCDECRAKYPEPVEYEAPCSDCNGDGRIFHQTSCPIDGCSHHHDEYLICEWCNGGGVTMTHDCNPGCKHPSLLDLLTGVTIPRGGIEFS